MESEYHDVDKRHLHRTPVSEVSYQKYGITSTVRVTQLTANIAKSEIVPSNPNRISMILINNSLNTIYINFGLDVSSSFGIVLSQSGGAFSMNINDEGEAVTASMSGLATADTSLLTLIETIVGGG
jgi:hypothetical protein